ncbi:MAG: hypothetical protein IPK60_10545 [Sandaracinaceae bacterium]|jgi:hypothetical protein|nr:hypothetical protein [Sandaracinaceae bacterium]
MKKIALGLLCLCACLTSVASAQDTAPVPPAADVAAPPAEIVAPPPAEVPAAPRADHETSCTGRRDEDGDGLVDCGDGDCLHDPACEAGQGAESTGEQCSDWIDNDGDDAIDCDDDDCENAPGCSGSWVPTANSEGGASPSGGALPQLGEGLGVQDLVGAAGDADGERSNELCSDGVDNDQDGRTDCADFGCRFDASITICMPTPGLRFSAVVGAGVTYNSSQQGNGVEVPALWDARFSRIQLRALGPIPFIHNSFFLINIRAERLVRLTFALFQIPVGTSGHYVNLNSGSGGLSASLIQSQAKQLLLDPVFFAYAPFEQGNGGAFEVGGPITSNDLLRYRVFAAAGSGQSNGNVGGRFFSSDDRNFTYGGGGQVQLNIAGHYDRLDTPYIYTPVPLTMAMTLGAKYDQRAAERYATGNFYFVGRYNRFHISADVFGKRELAFGASQLGYVVQAAFLIIPKRLLLAADWAQFRSTDFSNPGAANTAGIARPLDEDQFRAALHVYLFRNIALASIVYTHHIVEFNTSRPQDTVGEDIVRFEGQFRF